MSGWQNPKGQGQGSGWGQPLQKPDQYGYGQPQPPQGNLGYEGGQSPQGNTTKWGDNHSGGFGYGGEVKGGTQGNQGFIGGGGGWSPPPQQAPQQNIAWTSSTQIQPPSQQSGWNVQNQTPLIQPTHLNQILPGQSQPGQRISQPPIGGMGMQQPMGQQMHQPMGQQMGQQSVGNQYVWDQMSVQQAAAHAQKQQPGQQGQQQGYQGQQHGQQGQQHGQQGQQLWNQAEQGWNQGVKNESGWNLLKSGWDKIVDDHNREKGNHDLSWKNNQVESWKRPKELAPFKSDRYNFPNPLIKYKIVPCIDQKMALDVTSKDEIDKKLIKGNLIIWAYHGGPNQHFYINRERNGKYVIINASSGFIIKIPRSDPKDGAQLVVNPPTGEEGEYWTMKNPQVGKSGEMFILNSFCGKSLDVADWSTSNGAKILQWKENGGKNQLWKILPV